MKYTPLLLAPCLFGASIYPDLTQDRQGVLPSSHICQQIYVRANSLATIYFEDCPNCDIGGFDYNDIYGTVLFGEPEGGMISVSLFFGGGISAYMPWHSIVYNEDTFVNSFVPRDHIYIPYVPEQVLTLWVINLIHHVANPSGTQWSWVDQTGGAQTPEPSTLLMSGLALLTVGSKFRRKLKRNVA